MGNLEKAGVGVVVALLLVIIVVAFTSDTEKSGDGDNGKSGSQSASLTNNRGEGGLGNSRVHNGAINGAEVDYNERRGQDGERPVRVNSSENGTLLGAKPGDSEKPASLSKNGIVNSDVPEDRPLDIEIDNPSSSNPGTANDNGAGGSSNTPGIDSASGTTANDGSWPREVTVASGEMLWNIAEENYGASLAAKMVRRIQDVNGITDARQLQVGQRLKLPPPPAASEIAQPTATPSAAPTTTSTNSGVSTRRQPDVPTLPWEPGGPSYVTPKATGSGFYVVKPGDSLSKIAEGQLGSITEMARLMKLNGITDPNKLFVGQKLRLPAQTEGASTNK